MKIIFNRTFRMSAKEGFEEGRVYDLSPSSADYWKSLGVAADAPPDPKPAPAPRKFSPPPVTPIVPAVTPNGTGIPDAADKPAEAPAVP
jgi:hypothetical protein